MSKADYVRSALRRGRTQGHHCHWPGCDRKVPPAAWGCLYHWRKLPKDIRRRIWRAFQPGQEKSKTPSAEYIAAAKEAQKWIAEHYPATEQGAFDL